MKTKLYILFLLTFSLITNILFAQFIQQGPKLVGTGTGGNSQQGGSVALSFDGNTAVVGGTWDNNRQGAVWVYTRNGSDWIQQGPKLIGSGGGSLVYRGTSVAISSDGNTIVFGGPGYNSNIGAIWVFTRNGGVWTQQGAPLVGSDANGSASQGQSVAISSDGNTIIEGGYFDSGGSGAVWIFTRNGGIWTQQGPKLIGSDTNGDARQGISVSISSDGNTVIEGGLGDNGTLGAVWVFTRNGTVWTQQGPKLVGTGSVGNSGQGISAAISSDGNTFIEGGWKDNNFNGAVWIFTRNGGVWTQQGSKLVGTGSIGNLVEQGESVTISSNGNIAIWGGHGDNNYSGAVWVFTRSGGVWTQQGQKLIGSGAVGSAYQGYSVAISSDGNTFIEGGLEDNNTAGAAWIFTQLGIGVLQISNDIPKQFSLLQNYPNPFNPSSKIKFQITRLSDTKVAVYDVLGREVEVLVNQQLQPGTYEVNWNASNYPSGVYLYKLTAGDFSETKKMVLVK